MILDLIRRMFEKAYTDEPRFPPTTLFNETWMIRLVLEAYAQHLGGKQTATVPFHNGATWFSEAQLPSRFLARYRGDPLAEGWTHADGVVSQVPGDFDGTGGFYLSPSASQLTVLEAKMFTSLSAGTKKAPDYDQATRNVACMAELLSLAGRNPDQFDELRFAVIAPCEQIEANAFGSLVTHDSIRQKVRKRVASYEGQHDAWFDEWFTPTLERIVLDMLAWEDLISDVRHLDEHTGHELDAFYQQCLRYNR
jgi:hypothetical protein